MSNVDFSQIAAQLQQTQQQPQFGVDTNALAQQAMAQGGGVDPLGIGITGLVGAAAAKRFGPRIAGAARGLPARFASMARPFWTPATPPATPAMLAEQALMRNAVQAAAANVGTGGGTLQQVAALGGHAARADAAIAGAGQAGAMTPLGMVAAPVAGAVGGALAWQGVNSQDWGGEGSALDRGASGGAGGVLAGAGVGATLGSIIPGAGTAAGAVVGGIVGGIGGALANLKWGDDEKELKRRATEAGKKADAAFNAAILNLDVSTTIAQAARAEFTAQAAEIAKMDLGTDEKVDLMNSLAEAYTEELKSYAGTATQEEKRAQAQAEQQMMMNWQQKVANDAETQRAIAIQSIIGDWMKPYADASQQYGDPRMAQAIMGMAQATPGYLAMQRQADILTQRNQAQRMQIEMLNAQANYMNAQAGMNNSTGSSSAIDQLLAAGGQ